MITLDQVMACGPCYSREEILQITGGRTSLTLMEVYELDIPDYERIWVFAHCNLYAEEIMERAKQRLLEFGLVRYEEGPVHDALSLWWYPEGLLSVYPEPLFALYMAIRELGKKEDPVYMQLISARDAHYHLGNGIKDYGTEMRAQLEDYRALIERDAA